MVSLFHPLCGSNPDTLLKLLLTNGAIAPNRYPQMLLALAVSLARLPFSTLERVIWQFSPQKFEPMPDPVFIVGYWRSGTTHLHNLIAQSPYFGYITPLATGLPWDILGIVRALKPLLEKTLPEDRFVDNVAVTPNSPQEDSIPLATMGAASYYHGLYFPHHFEDHFRRDVFLTEDQADIEHWKKLHRDLLQKVWIHQKKRLLILKNPVYTGYIRYLREIWPKAKFIHIYRNPYRVFPSTQHYFNRMLLELSLQSYQDLPIESLIFESYLHLMQALKNDTADLPSHQFAELSFEALQANPFKELEKLFHQLEIPDFEAALPYLKNYLAQIQDYRQNQYSLDAETRAKIEKHWYSYIERWGYNYSPF